MNITNYKRLLRHTIMMAEDGVYIPWLLHGESGLGKSEATASVAEEESLDIVDLRLGQMEIGDIIGMPYKDDDGLTRWARPQWWPREGTRGFLFLDELNRSHSEVRQGIFQLVLDRKMNTHTLPKGWIIISAINPATDEYQVDELYDKAFLARFGHIGFEPTHQEWLDYAASSGVDFSIRAFIAEDAKFLGQGYATVPKVVPTPRTWVMLSKFINSQPPEDLIDEVATGLVGVEATTAWIKVRNDSLKPIHGEEILKGYNKTLQKKVQSISKPGSHRADLLLVTLDEINAICNEKKGKITDKELDNIVSFVKDIPPDMCFGFLKTKLVQINGLREKLGVHKELLEYMKVLAKDAGIKWGDTTKTDAKTKK